MERSRRKGITYSNFNTVLEIRLKVLYGDADLAVNSLDIREDRQVRKFAKK
jgi:hypothetical protein